jgi:hypothetical protein
MVRSLHGRPHQHDRCDEAYPPGTGVGAPATSATPIWSTSPAGSPSGVGLASLPAFRIADDTQCDRPAQSRE